MSEKSNVLIRWSGWFYLINLLLLWLIASQYLAIFFNGYGDTVAPTSLNELDSYHSHFFVWITFIFFAYSGYIAIFIYPSIIITFAMILLRFPKWLIQLVCISSATIITLYLLADTRIYNMYHYHINGVILKMFLSGDVMGIFDFSTLEWLIFIGGTLLMVLVQTGIAWLAGKIATKFNSKWFLIVTTSLIVLFVALSLQIFFYASAHLTFAKLSAALLLISTLTVFFYIWHRTVVKAIGRLKIFFAALPIIVLLFTFIVTAQLANLTPLVVIIILSSVITLLIFLYALLRWRMPFSTKQYSLPGLALLCMCALLMCQMFITQYVPIMRQIIEASYLFPLYDTFAATILSYSKHGKSFYRLNNGYFMQPKGLTSRLRYPLQILHYASPQTNYNVLMIVIDTWRYDALTPAVMPHVYQFAQKSWQYQNHWSGGNATQSGMFTLFYGLPSNYWTAMLNHKKGPVLIKGMLENHYQVNVFSSSELAIPALYKTVFLDVPNLKIMADGDYIYIRDENVNRGFFDFLEKRTENQPFFSVLFYDGAHGYCAYGNPIHKFQPEIRHCGRLLLNNDSNPIFLKNRYLNALYKIDILVGDVINKLESHHILDKTVVIITGDHGEEFNDNHLNYWAHASNYTKYQVQTPFILHWPHAKPKVITQQTSHFDVAPTLLKNVLACQNPSEHYAIGADLITSSVLKPYLIVGSYNSYGIVEKDRITQLLPDGNYLIYDHSFRPLPNAKLRTQILSKAMQDMFKYYSN